MKLILIFLLLGGNLFSQGIDPELQNSASKLSAAMPIKVPGSSLTWVETKVDGPNSLEFDFQNTDPVLDNPNPTHDFLTRFRISILPTLRKAQEKYFPGLKGKDIAIVYGYLNSDGTLAWKYVIFPDNFDAVPVPDQGTDTTGLTTS